jgi:hypothetical protein
VEVRALHVLGKKREELGDDLHLFLAIQRRV